MKIDKMIEKIEKIFDKTPDADFIGSATLDDGAIFAPNPYMIYNLPDHDILSVKQNEYRVACIKKTWDAGVKNIEKDPATVTVGYNSRKKLVKLTCDSDPEFPVVYLQYKFIKSFPKNTVFYIGGPREPVTAAIIENGKKYVFSAILPILVSPYDPFTPGERKK